MAGSFTAIATDGNAGVYYTCIRQRLTERSEPNSDAGGFGCVLHYRNYGRQGEMARI